ncbi:flap endonuclease-1 [Candidatus Woesearchaeota archaeon]|nr:flap endonuclease-1 [Candidatus Woesearchaeota archaeon]
MGTKLSSILTVHEISLNSLANKNLVIDAFNNLYQYLTTIRQQDGTPLMDSKGRITSHLSGLFFRTIYLIKIGLKLAFVFDGKPPELKSEERERRADIKREAEKKYQLAVQREDIDLMRKYASRTSKLTPEMVEEAKELIRALGLPIVQAPSEAEAQASYMVKKGDFYGLISQDTDGLLFGSTRLIKNLTISQRRKVRDTLGYTNIGPEEIVLSENLNKLGIDLDQLIVLGMLCGTDFNIGGIKGIGPKKGLKLVKTYGKDFDKLFKESDWNKFFEPSWDTVFNLIKNMPVTDNYELKWRNIDHKRVAEIMVRKHNFADERIENTLSDLIKKQKQKGLADFF